MLYAVVSDIHANLQAWRAALLDIRSLGVDKIVCLGDIVGYGPNPAEVLKDVYANVEHFVLGNHDAVICGKMDASLFNEDARRIIVWTRNRLNAEAIKFLRTLPLALNGELFRCTHGDFSNPAAFNYVIDPEDALPSWQAVHEQLLFIGHTHRPAMFLLGKSGIPRVVEPQDFVLQEEKRFLVNVGSVGQPRDGDARACYCVLDTAQRSVIWRRIPFDLDAYRRALSDGGVSDKPSYFLRHDPRLGTPPLRELLNFAPAETADQAAKDVVEVRELTALKRRVTKWRVLFTVLLLLALSVAAAAGTLWWRHHTRALVVADPSLSSLDALTAVLDTNMLDWPDAGLPAGRFIRGWSILLGDKRRQSVTVKTRAKGEHVIVLSSSTRKDELRLSSPAILVRKDMNFGLQAQVMRSADFTGNVEAFISLRKAGDGSQETVERFRVKEPNVRRKGGWYEARQTTGGLPARSTSIQVHLRGKFQGQVRVRQLSLERRK